MKFPDSALRLSIFFLLFASVFSMKALSEEFNYDESLVPNYVLPDPLVMEDGREVEDQQLWKEERRKEILNLFEEHVYGRVPENAKVHRTAVMSVDLLALDGKATRKEVRVYFGPEEEDPKMDILIYLPNQVGKPAPVFLGLNFYGNHTIHEDPGIRLPES